MANPTRYTDAVRGPLAFLADIHGNLAALDAVLEAVKEARAGAIYVAGDLVFPGDQPLEVWKRLQEVGARCVRGTTDRALATLDPSRLPASTERDKATLARFRQTREELGELILARLKRLPEALSLELPDGTDILVVHGSPRDPDEPITHDLDDDEVEALLADTTADVVVCGCGHVPFVRDVADTKVVAVGSVGDSPEGGVAHFTLIYPTSEGLRIEPRWVSVLTTA